MLKGLKSLIFVDESTSNEVQFPNKQPDIVSNIVVIGNEMVDKESIIPHIKDSDMIVCDPYIEDIKNKYLEGFKRLNKEGYDFHEFYTAAMQINKHDENTYNTLFVMAKTVNPSLTKEQLIADADEYISKIESIHKQYNTEGNNALTNKVEESLQKSQLLLSQIAKLEEELNDAKISLRDLDKDYANKIKEIKCTILANDEAKKDLLLNLLKVKQNVQGITS